MKITLFLKALLLLCSAFLWLSCSSWEEVVAPAEFQPLKIVSVSPESAGVGDEIVITGENFLKEKEYNVVWFTPQIAAKIDSATATQLFLKVPEGALSGSLILANAVYSDTSDFSFTVLKTAADPESPAILGFEPKTGISGTVVTLTGRKFGFKKEEANVFFGSVQAEVIEAADSVLKVRAPFNAADVNITMNVKGKTGAADGVFKTVRRKHKIELFTPNGGYIGDFIRILTVIDKKGDTSGIRFTLGKIPMTVIKVVSTKENYFDINLADMEFLVEIPERAASLPIALNFYGDEVKSNDALQIQERKAPVITSISPMSGYAGFTGVSIKGENFGSKVRVKIGTDAEAIVSVSDNQFNFTVPAEAKTGRICIQTLEGKEICSKDDFKVLKSIATEADISFGGIKIARSISSSWRSDGTIHGNGSNDTVVERSSFSFQKTSIPSANVFASISGCLIYPEESNNNPAPYGDSILQYFKSYINSGSTYTSNYTYRVIEFEIDSINKLYKTLKIIDVYYSNNDAGYLGTNDRECIRRIIKLKNVSYEKIDNTSSIKLNSSQFKEKLSSYNYSKESSSKNNFGANYSESRIQTVGIIEILPDAYFELTLE